MIVEHARMFYDTLAFSQEDRDLIEQEDSRRIFSYWIEALGEQETWSPDDLSALVKKGIGDLGIKGKNFYFPIRLALFGSCHGPDIPTLIDILGRDESVKRLTDALHLEQ